MLARMDGWNKHEEDVFNTVQKLTSLRSTQMPLLYGDFNALYISDKAYVYCRTYFDRIVIVVMNKSETEEKFTFGLPDRFSDTVLQDHFGTPTSIHNGNIEVTIKPRSFEVYTGITKHSEQ